VRLLVTAYLTAVSAGCAITSTWIPLVLAFVVALPVAAWIAVEEVRAERINAEVASFRAEMMQELP
jgi:hypothetical protein